MKTASSVFGLLDRFAKNDWFSRAGQIPVRVTLPVAIIRPMSWDEALEDTVSSDTESFLIELRNQTYQEQENSAQDHVRADEFNRWTRVIRSDVREISAKACSLLPETFAKAYEPKLQWTMMSGCVVQQFDHVIKKNRLMLELCDVLFDGHCVAGWRGRYPAGAVSVY